MPSSSHGWNFDHSYAGLPDVFFREQAPSPVTQPEVVVFNEALAEELGIGSLSSDLQAQAVLLGGNQLPPGAQPIAQAYAGHQFGHFTMLGDGRAILLGEQITPAGQRFDIQLKGAGRTPFSRRGDGRATLSSMLREYLMSEAMYHLGIPTSRSLAVVATGEQVYRQPIQTGAVLSRVASSHLRVGTFEFAKRFGDESAVRILIDYALARHYPERVGSERPALALLEVVMEKQVALIVNWLRVGFIHGVMNTDNMGIAGETFDYGPCAFMNAYDPKTVFSSIDTQGRYAYGHQARIAHWNLAVLAGALLPVVDPDEELALELVRASIDRFADLFTESWFRMMFDKLGLVIAQPSDRKLVEELLLLMRTHQADFTHTFLALRREQQPEEAITEDPDFQQWFERWTQRLKEQTDRTAALDLMTRSNPVRIARNHLVEAALEAAVAGNMQPFHQLVRDLQQPYRDTGEEPAFQSAPAGFDEGYKTYCGT
ncbi:MAG: YdiU family protein [Bacteroidota bacterium]